MIMGKLSFRRMGMASAHMKASSGKPWFRRRVGVVGERDFWKLGER